MPAHRQSGRAPDDPAARDLWAACAEARVRERAAKAELRCARQCVRALRVGADPALVEAARQRLQDAQRAYDVALETRQAAERDYHGVRLATLARAGIKPRITPTPTPPAHTFRDRLRMAARTNHD
jgi:hypothetical protein